MFRTKTLVATIAVAALCVSAGSAAAHVDKLGPPTVRAKLVSSFAHDGRACQHALVVDAATGGPVKGLTTGGARCIEL